MGCYTRNGRFFITVNSRNPEWPRLVLPTEATDSDALAQLESLVIDEILGGNRIDLAQALKRKLITLDALAARVGNNLKDVHNLTLASLGLSRHQLPPRRGTEGMPTFGELEAHFLRERINKKGNKRLGDETVKRYQQSFVCVARALGKGDVELGRAASAVKLWDSAFLSEYGSDRRDTERAKTLGHQRREERGVRAATVNRDHAALGALRAFARRRYATQVAGLIDPEVVREAEGDVTEHLLGPGEFNLIIERCQKLAQLPPSTSAVIKDRDWVMFQFMLMVLYWTGCRLSEMLRMKWSQWRFGDAEPFVMLEGHSELGDKGMRRLSIPTPILDGMLAWRKHATSRGIPTHGSAQVFHGPLVNKGTFQKAWKALREAMPDVPNVHQHRIHDFRHDAAVGWICAGASIEEVRKALGHKDRDVTYRYVKYQTGTMAEAGRRRAAMEMTNCSDPLLAGALVSESKAVEMLRRVIEAHPDLLARLASEGAGDATRARA
jgi:integrase